MHTLPPSPAALIRIATWSAPNVERKVSAMLSISGIERWNVPGYETKSGKEEREEGVTEIGEVA